MKLKLFFVFSLALLAAGFARANDPSFRVPISVNNVADPGLRSAGVETVKLVTSTTPALVTDSESATITDGFIYWIIRPSTTSLTQNYLELRGSTDTANNSSTLLIPTVGPVFISTNNVTAGSPIIEFNPPIPFSTGLSVNIQGTAAPQSGMAWGVGVRWKRQ